MCDLENIINKDRMVADVNYRQCQFRQRPPSDGSLVQAMAVFASAIGPSLLAFMVESPKVTFTETGSLVSTFITRGIMGRNVNGEMSLNLSKRRLGTINGQIVFK